MPVTPPPVLATRLVQRDHDACAHAAHRTKCPRARALTVVANEPDLAFDKSREIDESVGELVKKSGERSGRELKLAEPAATPHPVRASDLG
ncbi:MAG TPA: hypothetical protein VHT91_32345 [Kofleriaceae bacterium]|jgi:hypothetical protein|nr:hypothetical protein [Kofleriaceae bacterium]